MKIPARQEDRRAPAAGTARQARQGVAQHGGAYGHWRRRAPLDAKSDIPNAAARARTTSARRLVAMKGPGRGRRRTASARR